MARLPLVPEDASPEVSVAYAEIVKSRGRVLNVFSVLGHAPEGLRRLAAVGEYVRFQTQLPNRLRELLILATAATIGSVTLPAFRARGYDERLVLGSLAAGGTLGILIPPSINFIVYGVLME
ncbi:MAG TPA: TRAP transporter large permease subunit, partial [Methylomirabilota bacterium]|nr:TRAP transporter large permease subunit [Methylomirabilota bacterium]